LGCLILKRQQPDQHLLEMGLQKLSLTAEEGTKGLINAFSWSGFM
jgi:hypothetical protein